MTLTETLIAGGVLTVLLILVASGTMEVRGELKRRQAEQLLVLLDEALGAYQQVTGRWPSVTGMADDDKPLRGLPTSGDEAVELLARVAESQAVLARIPAVLRAVAVRGPASDTQPAGDTVHDAWGRRLRCLTTASVVASYRDAVTANGGRPIFISAGPDGRFGDFEPADAADNLRSDRR